jgi:hypothetical protein
MKIKRIVLMVLAFTMLLALASTALANGANTLQEYPPPPEGFVPYGASAPSSSASTHDLSVSAYNYQVQEVGAQVYTDKWLTGKSSMKVTVLNWKLVTQGDIRFPTTTTVTLTVYNSSGTAVASCDLNTAYTSYYTFTGLSSIVKYYVKFSVPLNEHTYSFNGSIS